MFCAGHYQNAVESMLGMRFVAPKLKVMNYEQIRGDLGQTVGEVAIFLQHALISTNESQWINKYFTLKEVEQGLKRVLFNIVHHPDEEKIEKIKAFYNEYEIIMSDKIRANFYYQVVHTGSIPLITYFYKEKGITKLNRVILLWHVCADTTATNTLEILNCLKDIGVKFDKFLLKKVQAHSQWDYMEHKDQLLYFFDNN